MQFPNQNEEEIVTQPVPELQLMVSSDVEIALQKRGRIPIGDPGFWKEDEDRPGSKRNRQPRHRRREQPVYRC